MKRILEAQVSFLKSSQRLKELGVKQESCFWWYPEREANLHGVVGPTALTGKWFLVPHSSIQPYIGDPERCSAFTVAELGEMLPWNYRLPHKLLITGDEYPCALTDASYLWEVRCHGKQINAITEADVRAKMLIHLIENNLFNPKEKTT